MTSILQAVGAWFWEKWLNRERCEWVCKQIIIERARIYLQLGYTYYAFVCVICAARLEYDERARKRQSLNAIISAARRAINSTWPANTARAKCYTVTTNYYQQPVCVCVQRISLQEWMPYDHACCYYCNLLFFSILKRVRDLPMPSLPAREPHQCASNNNFP